VSQRRSGMGLAVDLPGHATVHRSDHRPAPPPSPPRVGAAACCEARRAKRRGGETRELSHVTPLVRDASSGRRPRHPHRPAPACTPRRRHHDDLRPRPEPRAVRRPQPSGPASRLVTGSSVLYGKPLQPITTTPNPMMRLNLLALRKNPDGAPEVARLARLRRPQRSPCYTVPPNKS